MKAPEGALGDSRTRVLLAVVNLWRPTVRAVAAEVGLSFSATYSQLLKLRADGLVEWEPNGQGTLHPLVRECHEHLIVSGYTGPQNSSGPGTPASAPDLPNAPRRR